MYIHLHNHSHYSLLDGLSTVDQLVDKAKEHGSNALALTDHGVMYGVIEFYKKCKKENIKPIIGVEAYITPGSLHDKKNRIKPYHLILLAKNNEGYQNLLKLTSIAHLEGYYYKPRIDWDTLKKYSKGIIATTACLNGPISRHLRERDNKKAEENLNILLDIFTKDNIYLELQPRNMKEQEPVNKAMIALAKKFDLPLIATSDVHYTNSEDDEAHDILICIQTKQKKSDKDRMSYLGEDYSFYSPEKMKELFKDTPEAISNTQKLADRCNVEIELGNIQLPHYPLENITADEELERLSLIGIEKRYKYTKDNIPQDVKKRLDYELDIIKQTGYATYFLIVQDFVQWAKKRNIVVGPGRGSAAGSLVSYVLGITNIDPLEYRLIFERFLNPERISMPDIDLDFADVRRDEVLKYVEEKYGKDHVSQIITFGTMAARAAIRDVGRVLGYSYSYCDQVAKLIPMFTTLDKALETVEELKKVYEEDSEAQRLIDMAKKLEGLIRHSSTHACAVLITKSPLSNNTPLQYASSDDKTVISQYSMNPVEDLGLLKVDFLGLKNLTILEQSIKIIKATKNIDIDIDKIPVDDKKTFKLLAKGQTTGVFQLESGGMKRYLKQLKPSEIEDIIAMVALYRPGPIEFIPDFVKRKFGKKKIEYIHPKLEPILKNTYGIAIYQEQIMRIARELAGFTYGQADILRKAVGKKIKKLLDEQEEKMIQGMVNNGIEKQTASKIWEFIIPFARYGFNRSHAASYAMIAYQTAYLKSNYPAAFMAALLTSSQNNIDRVTIEINECHNMGIRVLPPDINESFANFSVVEKEKEKTKIRFGLNAIKNVGYNIVDVIVEERKENGIYKSLEDFLNRIKDKDLNKKSLESLIKGGALDSLITRGKALGNLNTLLEFNKKIQNEHKTGQNNLFADLPLDNIGFSLKLDEFEDVDINKKLSWEKELLGLYLSNHPFKKYLPLFKKSITTINELKNKEGENVIVAGIITNIHKIITNKGKPMLFITIEDSLGSVELLIFPKLLETTNSIWKDENMIIAEGKVSDKDGNPKVLTEKVKEIDQKLIDELDIKRLSSHKLWLNIPSGIPKEKVDKLKEILEYSKGLTPVYIKTSDGKKIRTNLKVLPNSKLLKKISKFLGEKVWKIEK